jgi:hypothetical protein
VTGLLRFTVSALFLGTVLTGVVSVYPQSAEALGVEFRNLPALERQVEQGKCFAAELDERGRTIFRRLEDKRRVTLELLEGRLSLLQAAVRFRELNARPRQNPVDLRDLFPGRSDAERVCRQVISWVSGEEGGIDPKRREVLQGALEKELEQLLASGRPLAWPDQQSSEGRQ